MANCVEKHSAPHLDMMMSSPIIQLFFSLLPRILESERIFSFSEAPPRKSRWTFSLILRPPTEPSHTTQVSPEWHGKVLRFSSLSRRRRKLQELDKSILSYAPMEAHEHRPFIRVMRRCERKNGERENCTRKWKIIILLWLRLVGPRRDDDVFDVVPKDAIFSCAECVGTEPVFRVLFFSLSCLRHLRVRVGNCAKSSTLFSFVPISRHI